MNKILFNLLLFWYATKAKFWDFCLKKVLKHHPSHQYEYNQLVEDRAFGEVVVNMLNIRVMSPTYKKLFEAYCRKINELENTERYENQYHILVARNIEFQRAIRNLEEKIEYQNGRLRQKLSKCQCSHSK